MKIKIAIIISILLMVSAYAQQRNEQKLSLAQSYEQIGEFSSAVKLYEELYESDPTNSQYISSLYRVYTQLKNYAALVNILDERLKQNPDDIDAYGMLGSTYYLMGNEEKAFEVWKKPFQSGAVNPVFYRLIANYVLERRAFEFAIELYEEGKKASNDRVIYSFDLARLYSITMQFEKAAQQYCDILSIEPSQQNVVEIRVFENINRPGALDATLKVIEDCADKNNLSFSYLLARLYTEKKSYEQAYEIYLNIDESLSSKGRELYNFARQMFAEKEYKLSAEIFKTITEKYPDSPIISQAFLGYAQSLEASLFGDYKKTLPLWKPYFPMEKFQSAKTEEVLSAFNVVTNLYKHSEPAYESILRTAVIKFYLLKDYEDAKRILEIIVSEAALSKNSADAYLELGNIAVIEGNLNEAEKDFSAILKLRSASDGQKNKAVYKLGKLNFYQGHFDEAKKHLSKVIGNLKDNSANDAIELLLLLNPQMNDSSNLLTYAEAEFLSEQKKFDDAAVNYKKLADNQQAFVLHTISAVKYGEMLLAVDNYTESISVLEGVAAEGEKNIYADKAVYLLGKINQYGIKNYGKAEEFYQKLLAEYPKSIYADDARAQILLLQDKPGT
ncbi:MAG: tetratricopeptide repeat protein [Ignavibacteria bacterium]|nr:tetratricopeptide repeat protein [Ignavibacteria bacterium]